MIDLPGAGLPAGYHIDNSLINMGFLEVILDKLAAILLGGKDYLQRDTLDQRDTDVLTINGAMGWTQLVHTVSGHYI